MRLFFDWKNQFYVTFAGANERNYGIKVVQKFQLYAAFPPRRDDNHIVEIRQKSQLYAAFPLSGTIIIKLKSAIIQKEYIFVSHDAQLYDLGVLARRSEHKVGISANLNFTISLF